jgi:hypothetical protein
MPEGTLCADPLVYAAAHIDGKPPPRHPLIMRLAMRFVRIVAGNPLIN